MQPIGALDLWVGSSGIACSVGLSAPAAMHAVAAGISGLTVSPFFDNDDDPIVGSSVGLLAPDLALSERIHQLVSVAVLDCLSRVSSVSGTRVGLFVGGAQPQWPGAARYRPEQVANAIAQRLPSWLRIESIRTSVAGHCSAAKLLLDASRALCSGGLDAALVCAGDSLMSARVLRWLDQHQRLKLPSRSDGLVPGEAAGCLWITPRRQSLNDVRVAGVGFGSESATPMNQDPLLGTGLADAVREALACSGVGFERVQWRSSDATGEDFWFREQVLLLARLLRRPKPSVPLWHPAEFIGAVGAAAGAVQLALVFQAFAMEYAPRADGIVCTTDDFGERAAMLIQGQTP